MPGTAGNPRRPNVAMLASIGAGAALVLAVELTVLAARGRPGGISTPFVVATVVTAAIGLMAAAVLSRRDDNSRRLAEQLQSISDPTIDALEDQDLLAALAGRLRGILAADEVAVLLPTTDGRLRLAAGAGLDAAAAEVVDAAGFPGSPAFGFSPPVVVPSGWRRMDTAVNEPVTGEAGMPDGVVHVGWTKRRSLREEDQRLLTLTAGRVRSVVHRRRLVDDEHLARLSTEGAEHRLGVLAYGGQALATALDSYEHEVMALAEVCVPAFADLFSVELVNPDGRLTPVVCRTEPTSGLDPPDSDGWHALLELVLADGRSRFEFNGSCADDDSGPLIHAVVEHLRARSAVVVPVRAGGLSLGTLSMATGGGRRGFRRSDLAVVEDLASRLGVAVQRVLLYRQLRASAAAQSQATQRLRRLTEAAIVLAASVGLERVLEDSAAEARRVMRVAAALIVYRPADRPWSEERSGRLDEAGEASLAAVAAAAIESGGSVSIGECLAAPLVDSEQVCRGALCVAAQAEFPLNDDDEAALVSLAQLVALVLGRAELTSALALRGARLNAVLDASPVAILRLSPGGEVQEGNPAAQHLFGWPDGSDTGPLPEIVGPALLELVALAARGEASTDAEVQGAPSGGEPLDLSVAAAPVRGPSGQVEAVLLLVADVSERRRAERRLQMAQRLEAMGQVAGGVAHDFNNLLTVIVGYTEALLAAADPGDPTRPLLESIERAGASAAAFTRQLLGLAGGHVAAPVALAPERVLADLEPVVRRLLGPDVEVVVGMSSAGSVVADPGEVERALLNLAINARDAMPDGGRLELSVMAEVLEPQSAEALVLEPGPYVVISVADTGTGMDEATRARCFEPFFTTKVRGRGTGLGLAGVYAVAREAGGAVEVATRVGGGSTFRIWLPRSDLAPAVAVAAPAPVVTTGSGLVLLVEDEEEIRELARHTLMDSGFTVVTAAGGAAALSAFGERQEPFAVLVTDIVMPGMRGTELARLLSEAQPSLQVLYVSGYAGEGPQAGGMINGTPVLRKPFRRRDLVAGVARLAERHRGATQGSKR